MKKINLRADKFKTQKKKGGAGVIFFGSLILFVSLAFYGWFYFQNKKVENEITSAKKKITQERKDIQDIDFGKVYNFEKRLISLENQMAGFIDKSSSFNKIAAATFPEAYFNSMKIASGDFTDSYEATLLVPDLLFLAKQVKAYETVDGITNLDFGEISFTDNAVSTNLKFNLTSQDTQSIETREESNAKNN